MQYLGAISKMTAWSLFISKENRSIPQESKIMPWLVMLKKLTLNGFMKTYTHCSVLARRIPGTWEPRGLLSMGSHRVRHDWSDLAAAAAQDLLELTPKKDVLFIIGNWNANLGSQETPGVTGKFDLVVQNEARQRLIELCQENALVIATTLFQQHNRRLYT